MRRVTVEELKQVCGAGATVLKLTVVQMEIMVTHGDRFEGTGTYGGHRLNMILYANEVHSLNDKVLPYDVSDVFYHNGHKIVPTEISGGHRYSIFFNQG